MQSKIPEIICVQAAPKRLKMKDKNVFTKILAILGTVLVWLPILAPVLFSAVTLFRAGIFRFDYLMPAEFFMVALIGGALLVWAALRARTRRGLICWGIGIAAVMLVGGQELAVVSGLASGRIGPSGVWWTLVIASLVIYSLALVLTGVGGALLLGDLFKPSRPDKEN
jgi:hypothetical protein